METKQTAPKPKRSHTTKRAAEGSSGTLNRDVYSVQDFAQAIGVNYEYILDAIRKGELRAIKIGGSSGYRILHASGVEWLVSREAESTDRARAEAAKRGDAQLAAPA